MSRPQSRTSKHGSDALPHPGRILIAPHEIAGQMGILARSLREAGHDALAVSYQASSTSTPVDRLVGAPGGLRGRAKRLAFGARAAFTFDTYHFFFGESLLPRLADLPLLRARGARILVHFRGSDIRSRRWVMDRTQPHQHPWQVARVNAWRRRADRILVSTPDLLALVPEAIWIPQAYVSEGTPQPGPVRRRTRSKGEPFRIVHAPSEPSFKGTPHLVAAVDRLRARGAAVELDLLHGRTHQEVIAALDRADAGVDQLLIGWYGNAAIEMMARGLPVVGFVEPHLRSEHAPDLPLLHATPDSIESRLEQLIAMSDDEREDLAQRGGAYVAAHHDASRVRDAVLAAYRSAWTDG